MHQRMIRALVAAPTLLRRSYVVLREDGASVFLQKLFDVLVLGVITPDLPARVVFYVFAVRSRLFPHVSDANPIRPRWINPDEIRREQCSDVSREFGVVLDGDWDARHYPFEENVWFASLQDRYRDGTAWSETAVYRELRSEIERGGTVKGCSTLEEFDRYLEYLDEVYRRISEHGYESQLALRSARPGDTGETYGVAPPHPALNEVGVNIHRDGTLARAGAGQHRLAIAKIVGIEQIPATVRVRHAEWQAIRDEIDRAESRAQLSPRALEHLDHPDVRDVVPPAWRSP